MWFRKQRFECSNSRYRVKVIIVILSLEVSSCSDWSMQVANAATCDEALAPHVRILDVEIGKDDFEGVQRRVGQSRLVRSGDASGATAAICYRSASPGDKTKLTFESSSIGAGRLVTAFELRRGDTESCTSSALVTKQISTPGGMRLDMSRRDIERLLGSTTRDSTIVVECSRDLPLSTEDLKRIRAVFPAATASEYTIYIQVTVELAGNRVVAFRVEKTETY